MYAKVINRTGARLSSGNRRKAKRLARISKGPVVAFDNKDQGEEYAGVNLRTLNVIGPGRGPFYQSYVDDWECSWASARAVEVWRKPEPVWRVRKIAPEEIEILED
jgi:hypothetical protein